MLLKKYISYFLSALRRTEAVQVVCGNQVGALTGGFMGELRWVNRMMDGMLQEMIQTAMGTIVWGRTNTKKV